MEVSIGTHDSRAKEDREGIGMVQRQGGGQHRQERIQIITVDTGHSNRKRVHLLPLLETISTTISDNICATLMWTLSDAVCDAVELQVALAAVSECWQLNHRKRGEGLL